jgi:hypothetical protein
MSERLDTAIELLIMIAESFLEESRAQTAQYQESLADRSYLTRPSKDLAEYYRHVVDRRLRHADRTDSLIRKLKDVCSLQGS